MGFFDFLFKTKTEDTPHIDEVCDQAPEEPNDDFPFLKNNPFRWREMGKSELRRNAEIINESDTIIDTSNNNETRARRCELCIKLLYEICACFPGNREYAVALGNALKARDDIKADIIRYGLIMSHKKPLQTYEEIRDFINQQPLDPNAFKAPLVDGKPIWEYDKTHKDDLQMMHRCCVASLKESQRSKTVPAVFFFWRVAVLAKKEKRYDIEVEVCQSFLEFVDAYTKEMLSKGKVPGSGFPDISQSAKVKNMRERLPKALANLKKST